jgi:hypothetical protein
MTQDRFLVGWWANNLDQLDREIARLALLCEIRILGPGVIARVLHKDASACGSHNEIAFAKLRDVLMVHLAIRERSTEMVGQGATAGIEANIIARLKASFPQLGSGPPGFEAK